MTENNSFLTCEEFVFRHCIQDCNSWIKPHSCYKFTRYGSDLLAFYYKLVDLVNHLNTKFNFIAGNGKYPNVKFVVTRCLTISGCVSDMDNGNDWDYQFTLEVLNECIKLAPINPRFTHHYAYRDDLEHIGVGFTIHFQKEFDQNGKEIIK